MICRTGKFTLIEQLWMQITFQGMWLIGLFTIFIASPLISLIYLLFVTVGILFFIMHLWICPRCPHIKEHNACVQLPPFLTKRIIKKDVSGGLNIYEKAGFFVFLYGVFVFPLAWVIRNQYLFIPYILLGVMHYSAYYFHFCRKCLNVCCPQRQIFHIKSIIPMNKYR